MSMSPQRSKLPSKLPTDRRVQQGGAIFLASLLVFFIAGILVYAIYAYDRRADPQSGAPLPASFLVSTLCLVIISGLAHAATRTVRRDKRDLTLTLLLSGGLMAIVFMAIQAHAINDILGGPALDGGTAKGVAGMVVVLVILHAIHVAGGVIALAFVSVRSLQGRYDHERHWPIDFSAQYWHFLDLVWLCMLTAFWLTTGGFR